MPEPPGPEQEIPGRLREAIFGADNRLDPATVVLISVADSCDVLGPALGRKELKTRRNRIKTIINGEATGKAAKEVIQACQAAVMVAVIMPGIMAATTAAR